MGAIFGFFKFLIGVTLGSVIGATVATLIVTRDGSGTLEKLRGVVDEMVEGGKSAAREEEARMLERREELIGEAVEVRQLKAEENKAVDQAKKELKKDLEKKNKNKK